MIRYLLEANVDAYHLIRKKEDKILQFIPFNSARKRACTAVRHPTIDGLVRVYVKGAPEIVLDLCESYLDKDGNVQELGKHKKDSIIHDVVVNTFAK